MDHLWTETEDSVTVVHFGTEYGSIRVGLLANVESILARLSDQNDPPLLLLDFRDTDYFGAGFITAMIRTYDRVMRNRGEFALCRANANLIDELEAVRLDHLWVVYESREDGVNALAGKRKSKC